MSVGHLRYRRMQILVTKCSSAFKQAKGLIYSLTLELYVKIGSKIKWEKAGAALAFRNAELVKQTHCEAASWRAFVLRLRNLSGAVKESPHSLLDYIHTSADSKPKKERQALSVTQSSFWAACAAQMKGAMQNGRDGRLPKRIQLIHDKPRSVTCNGKYPIFSPRMTTHGRLASFRLCVCVFSATVSTSSRTQARLFFTSSLLRGSRWGAALTVCCGFDL